METNVSTVIVVTGASRGIGKAIALSLAAPDTALIINCSKSAGKLELVKEEIIKKGALCETFVGDVSNYSTVNEMFDLAISIYGKVNVLINNAGIASMDYFRI